MDDSGLRGSMVKVRSPSGRCACPGNSSLSSQEADRCGIFRSGSTRGRIRCVSIRNDSNNMMAERQMRNGKRLEDRGDTTAGRHSDVETICGWDGSLSRLRSEVLAGKADD